MILANYAQQNRNCVREVGQGFTNPFAQFKPQLLPIWATTDGAGTSRNLSAFNHGYNPPYSWGLPMGGGGLASTLQIVGTGSIGGTALAVKLATAALSGSGSLAAVGSLIVQAIAALSGSGGISSADLKAFLQAVASISGSGGISSASARGLGALVCALTGLGTVSPTLTGRGEMTADLVVTGTGLTTSNVGQAVWAALAAANNSSGTMGEKLNDAGSAANPWTEVIESGYTAEEVLRILLAVAAGKTTITDLGGGNATVAFRDQADSKNRIEASMTDSERTSVTIDGT